MLCDWTAISSIHMAAIFFKQEAWCDVRKCQSSDYLNTWAAEIIFKIKNLYI